MPGRVSLGPDVSVSVPLTALTQTDIASKAHRTKIKLIRAGIEKADCEAEFFLMMIPRRHMSIRRRWLGWMPLEEYFRELGEN